MTPPAPVRPVGALRAAAPIALIATVHLVTVELVRAATPLLDLAAGRIGVVGAAGVAAVIFVAPALPAAVVGRLAPVPAAAVTVGLVLVLRLVAQAQDPATLAVVGAGAAAAVAALVVSLRVAGDGVTAAVGLLLGTVADLTLRTALLSWDPIVRPGVVPWLVVAVEAAVAVGAVALRWRPHPTGGSPLRGRWALGPFLALYVLGFGSAPIAAAHGGVPLPLAGAVLVVAAVAGVELVTRMRLPGGTGAIPEPDRWFAGVAALVALVAGVVAAYWATGPVALAGLAVAAVAAAVLLARALTPREAAVGGAGDRAAGTAAAAAAAGLGYLLPVMVYQVHYELEFPFDNRYALVAAAVLLGVAGSGARPRERADDRRPLWARPAAASALATATLLVPLAVAVTRPAVPAATQTGADLRLMSWNVMYGRHHTDGVPDPEAVAAAIEAAAPDVVLLQEVSRGWPIGGGVDLLEYLSRRLAMPYRWSPAADGQFGNAVLTRLPVRDVVAERLPFVQGPMERSYLAVTLRLDGGREVRLINAHLQHRKENTPTRLVQTRALLDAWGGLSATVVAGDFNFWPSWPEAGLWEEAGFVSAQDVTGHGGEFTVPSDAPDNRVDWIFGTPDVSFSDFEILTDVTVSDHFPLVVTVSVDG
ncbi:MAG TPA: endonuclease/exonuclease/phosphatase family protein [Natronosporangium sp.]|jgi:endonuclease/exonuclease/phosphatase family metal-dependent hydrolase